jgi:hypothetical protein
MKFNLSERREQSEFLLARRGWKVQLQTMQRITAENDQELERDWETVAPQCFPAAARRTVNAGKHGSGAAN